MSIARSPQLDLRLDLAWHPTGRGGARPGAGRPRSRSSVSHDERPEINDHDPVHVTVRAKPGVALRAERVARMIKSSIIDSQVSSFSIVHYSIQHTHAHMLVETDDRSTLASGMIGLTTRIVGRVNRVLRRRGELFDGRYHARVLATPSEVHRALRYVLLNARHHADEHGETLPPTWIDRHSSALAFDGWAEPIDQEQTFTWSEQDFATITVPPRTWLLGHAWKRHGLLRFDEVPGKPRKRR
jgi:hypothetical protein